jgi:hypothetical protein
MLHRIAPHTTAFCELQVLPQCGVLLNSLSSSGGETRKRAWSLHYAFILCLCRKDIETRVTYGVWEVVVFDCFFCVLHELWNFADWWLLLTLLEQTASAVWVLWIDITEAQMHWGAIGNRLHNDYDSGFLVHCFFNADSIWFNLAKRIRYVHPFPLKSDRSLYKSLPRKITNLVHFSAVHPTF